MDKVLAAALEWLAAHPDSSARQIAQGIGERDDRRVWRLLDGAAYGGRCQRWRPAGSGRAWLWEIPSGRAEQR